jgi:DNA-binding winged helix-turn-helix (wHTH) protein
MSTPPHEVFRFGDFRLDADKLLLYHKDILLKGVEKKGLEVLAAILRSGGDVATYDEIIEAVWPGNSYGVTSARVNQHISKLQKVLLEYEPGTKYFENIKGRGYRFVPILTPLAAVPASTAVEPELDVPQVLNSAQTNSRPWILRAAFIVVPVLVLVGVAAAWIWIPRDEHAEIEKLLRESQEFESHVLLRKPDQFEESIMDRYWTKASDSTINPDRIRIWDSVVKMAREGKRYGDETKCEQFEIQSLNIDKTGTTATARVLEKWFIAVYLADGTLHKNRTVGPYFVDYILKKHDGRWYVEKSTTGRVLRPTPQLIDVNSITAPEAGKEFVVNITGKDLEPMTVFLEVIGAGCPDTKPCKVPNSALVERAKVSETVLQNVPLTLGSGEFQIVARNGDSKPSNPVLLHVP